MFEPKVRRAPGRKRDPFIEPRVFDAALRVYARDGWGGFTFESIARAAGVGKPAIYRRWSSREELLVAALDMSDFPTARDCGSVRADLLDYAGQWVKWYEQPDRALAARRVVYDGQASPALLALHRERVVRPRTEAARDITRRAIKRGEIAKGVRSSTIVDLLVGGLSTHWEMTAESGRSRLRRTFPSFAESLVDIIIAGVQAVSVSAALNEPSVDSANAEKQASRHPH
ncbi:TetR/AcrR family transcriptional regulator [Mycobacterium sp. UM_CSW]|uniref:TetR/AcrR family transcriptional regulator n=1 Tax=Mycobacterium sp. UM_CSW TaxID=1370119 RepID=UPI00195538E7|nr:TetR/AcrR family transcriptional regulator [Mycobacterium sp. UM_CSW]